MRGLKGERSSKLLPILIGMVSVVLVATVIAIIAVVNNQNKITNVYVDQSTVQESYILEDGVNLNTIKLVARKANGKTYSVSVDEDLLSIDDLNKLKQAGEHAIEINYKGFSCGVTIKIINVHKVNFVVDGRVKKTTYIDHNEVVDVDTIPVVSQIDGFEVVWLMMVGGVTDQADFSLPIVANTTFEVRYKANLSIKAEKYLLPDGETAEVKVNNDSSYTLKNLDQTDIEIFNVQFKNSSVVYLGGDCIFKLNMSPKYNLSAVIVKNNGINLSLNNGYYRINNVQEGINITIENISLNTYSVEFIGVYFDNGSVKYTTLKSSTVPYGATIGDFTSDIDTTWHGSLYQGEIPVFVGWTEDDDVEIISNKKVYTQYDGVAFFTVYIYQQTNIVEECGNIYIFEQGEVSIPSEYEVKLDPTQQYTYNFSHWEYWIYNENDEIISKTIVASNKVLITENKSALVAVFSTLAKEYTISLFNYDGSEYLTVKRPYATGIISEVLPKKPSTLDNIYVFDYWSKTLEGERFEWTQLTDEEKDLAAFNLYAVFKEAPREYSVNIPSGAGYEFTANATKIKAGQDLMLTVTYETGYTQNISDAVVIAKFYQDGNKVDEYELALSEIGYNYVKYEIDNVYNDIQITIVNVHKNVYAVSYYDDVDGGSLKRKDIYEHGNFVIFPDIENIRKSENEFGYYSCFYTDKNLDGITEISNLTKSYDIYVKYYKPFEIVIDTTSEIVNVVKGLDNVETFSTGGYADGGLGQNSHIGWYLDDQYSILWTNSNVLANQSNPKLYTIKATLEKLDLSTGRKPIDTSIEGVVVLPMSGSESIDSSAFANCTNMTGIILPSTVTSIGENAFIGCSSLEYIVVGKKMTFPSVFKPNNPTGSETKIYYFGSESEFTDEFNVTGASNASNVYYYSQTRPTDIAKKSWRYVAGRPENWGDIIINDVKYRIQDDGNGNKYAVVVQYVGTDPNFSGCIKVESEVDGLKVSKILSYAFSSLKIRQIVLPVNIIIEDRAFQGTTGINKVFIYSDNESDSLGPIGSYNNSIKVATIRYKYYDDEKYNQEQKVGNYWHYNKTTGLPEPLNEVQIGDFTYSLNKENNTAVLISYDGIGTSIVIDTVEYDNEIYVIEKIASYAFSGKSINDCKLVKVKVIDEVAFTSCEIINLIISDTLSAIFNDAFLGCGGINVKISSISKWEEIDLYNNSANPLLGKGKLFTWDTSIHDYQRVEELEIFRTVDEYRYYGINLQTLIVHEGATIKEWAFSGASISQLRIESDETKITTIRYNAIPNKINTVIGNPNWSNWIIDSSNSWLYRLAGKG